VCVRGEMEEGGGGVYGVGGVYGLIQNTHGLTHL
jgi:hypothetical protein